MYRILVVEDQGLLLESLAFSLNTDSNIEVVGKLYDIALAKDFIKKNKIDLLLSDVCTLNNHVSIDYIEDIKKEFPDIKIVLMTSFLDVTFIEKAKVKGADGFVYKNVPINELIDVVNNVMKGYTIFPSYGKESLPELSNLTPLELSIVKLGCEGHDLKSIAEELCYSEKTIRNYVSIILEKTGFSSLAKLCFWAIKNGYIVS